MEQKTSKRTRLRRLWGLCPGRHILVLLSGALILLHLLTRGSRDFNRAASDGIVRPIHRALGTLCGYLPFSAAELLIALAALGLCLSLVHFVLRLLRGPDRLRRLYRYLMGLAAFGLAVYAGFCLLWGVFYYADDFMDKSGLERRPISAEELKTVTAWFAELADRSASEVSRDEDGFYVLDREALLLRSESLYDELELRFPCLEGPRLRPKGVFFSRLLSYTDFTGFFFPFTGEANVNTDFPPSLFPATAAHELAHQRGVAREQEANFVAVMACLGSDNPDFVYSGALLAYTHLSNALYRADRAAWDEISASLSEDVQRDFAANRAYWRRFETPVQTVSNTVYEGFLYSYDQELGLKSYGACVDLLVTYYLSLAQGRA